jgi:hypothetical protein
MKPFYIILLVILAGCSEHFYVYDVSMKHPVDNKTLIYENDTFKLTFYLEPKDVHLKIFNKTEEGIKINWDDVSMSLFGNANRIVHKETSFAGVTFVQPSTTIPPHSELSDYLIPSKNVHFYVFRYDGFVIIDNQFPDYEYGDKLTIALVKKLKGSEIRIYLPYYLGEARISKYYVLNIDNITSYKKKPANWQYGKTPSKIGNSPVRKNKTK